jgi:hypothetical protein
MRSRAEGLLRVVALSLLAWSLARALGAAREPFGERATSHALRSALVRWSTIVAPSRVDVHLSSVPTAVDRDWLAALRHAGTRVTWRGSIAVATAVMAEPLADPAGGARVTMTAPRGTTVVLSDERGPLDSVRMVGPTAAVLLGGAVPGRVTAIVGSTQAVTVVRDSLPLRRLLVLGAAGWEAKFVGVALEERGWKIDAHYVVSPKSDVWQGRIVSIDTGAYSAVLALDTTASRYGEWIRRYVAEGGGLVLWADAARTPVLAPLAAATAGSPIPDDELLPTDSAPRRKLTLVPLTALRSDAIALERRDALVAVAARRIGIGRVVEIGYEDIWRWRMHGGADAPSAHRAWLASQIASVAYTGARDRALARTDESPFAMLVDELGRPDSLPAPRGSLMHDSGWGWIFAALAAALLLEWVSRRVRGAC